MLSHNPYQDSGADCAELFDPIGAETAYAFQNPVWNHLDPQLGAMNHYQHSSSYGWKKHYYSHSHSFIAYDQTAHGFSSESQLQHDDHLYQLGLGTAWHGDLDQYRHLRYVSPTDGGSLASSDSTFSDYALSPDVSKAPTSFPFVDIYPSPANSSARGYFSPMYQPTPAPVLQPSTLTMASPTACSMKEVQYTPDDDLNDAMMEDSENKIKVQPPEELELTEGPSPHDSGLGQSVNDANDVEEQYETPKAESDDDSDFTPHRAAYRTQSTPLRASLRTPRRTASQPAASVIQAENARVNKSSNSKTKRKLSNNKISTTKNVKDPIHNNKTTKPKEKSFPCPFHPFGCPATFPSKNEWKRHTASQHLQLGFFRCDLGACHPDHSSGLTASRGFNDFNRKDLFTQHCRRMHRPEGWGSKEYNQVSKKERGEFDGFMEGVRERCWRRRRRAPEWLVCAVEGCGREWRQRVGEEEGRAWEVKMEHVARHYELGVGREEEGVDEGLREWAVRVGLLGVGGLLVGLEGDGGADQEKGGGCRMGTRRGRGYSLRVSGKVDDIIEIEVKEDGDDNQNEHKQVQANEDDDTDAEGEEE